MRVMVEFPLEEAQAVTGQLMDRDLEESALQRIERALRIEQNDPARPVSVGRDGEDR